MKTFMIKFKQNQFIYFVVCLMLLLFPGPVNAAFTIDDEKKLGKQFYEELKASQLIYKDKVLNQYINQIGNRILAQTPNTPFNFNFNIVDSSAINAFATPGGYIYINKGLILAAKSEAELAGVMAHEIGHANARHIASIIDKSQKLNVAALTAILASILLGGGSEASGAITAFSLAGTTSMTLKYMREHEEEADRLGIQYLVGAGYDPTAMIDFLKMMKQYEFLSKTMPSYLQTHPGTDDRIYYLDSLIISRYHPSGAKNIIGNFRRIQARIPLDATNLNYKYNELLSSLEQEPNNIDIQFHLALVEEQLGNTESAIKRYQNILNISPNDKESLKNIGSLYIKTGKPNLALEYLYKATKLDPEDEDVIFLLGRAYFSSGNYRKALEHYLRIKDKTFNDADINYFLAMTYGRLNDQGESHYYFGLHFKNTKRMESALFHFKEAMNYFPKNSSRYELIAKEIKELEARKYKKQKTDDGVSSDQKLF